MTTVIHDSSRATILTPADLEALDETALEILARTGVLVPSPSAREALSIAGASVDNEVVRLPPNVVRRLVGLAPPSITLGARARPALQTGRRPLLTTDGCCVEIYDIAGGKRPTTGQDVADIARVADALPELDFCWPAVSAQDSPAEFRGLHELYLTLAHTGKHVQTVTIVDGRQAAVAVRMAATIAGGRDGLRREPLISALLGTVTPLSMDEGTLEAGLVFAQAGVPVGFVTMPMGGSTTPITMAGSLVVAVAEALAGVCAVQATCPRAPVFICFIPSIMDLKTGDFTGGAPEDVLMGAAVADIGHYYGVPTQCGVNSSGAKGPGWQSALDDSTTTFVSMACGVDMLTGVGMVFGGRIFSYEEMVLGAEIACRARRILEGIDLGREKRRSERRAADGCETEDITDPRVGDAVRSAHERVRALLAEHQAPPLEPAIDEELRELACYDPPR